MVLKQKQVELEDLKLAHCSGISPEQTATCNHDNVFRFGETTCRVVPEVFFCTLWSSEY